MNKKIVIAAGFLMILGIVSGAFGAHALKSLIAPEKLASYETGVRYLIYHALALLIIGLNAEKFNERIDRTVVLFYLGVTFFSGSIFLLALQEVLGVNLSFLGPVTPVGGLLLITAWLILIIGLLRKQGSSPRPESN